MTARDGDRNGRGVVLVGYRGTGKSTAGRILADRLRRPFLDADAALEHALGCSIRTYFERHGESAFRDAEEQALAELETVPGRVIATGGGAVLRPSNRDVLRRYGVVVWLTADPADLAQRLSRNPAALASRPALTAAGTLAEIDEILKARTPLYREVADLECTTDDRTTSQVADAILAALQPFGFESRFHTTPRD